MQRKLAPVVAVAVALLVAGGAQAAQPEVERIAGEDRFATAAAVSEATFPDGAEAVYVATGVDFPDALSAGPVAGTAGAPILLVTRGTVPEPTRAELQRLGPDSVVILGGEAAVSRRVEAELAVVTGTVPERVAGHDRYATAAAVSASAFGPGVDAAYVATGADFPDALAGASAAAFRAGPVLLTRPDSLPGETADELRRLDPRQIVVLGGSAAVTEAVEERLADFTTGEVRRVAGSDRFATASELASQTFDNADVVYLATGAAFPDALAGTPAAAAASAPVLLSPRECIEPTVWETVESLGPERIVLLGGPRALGAGVERLVVCGVVSVTVVTDGLSHPWDVAFTPDGGVFVSERDSGRVLEQRADGSFGEVQRIPVNAAGEGGLLGLTPSPDYGRDGLLYAYLTTATDNRIVRFRPDGQPEPVLTGIPRSSIHNGGRVAFGPDGLLYATTGDAAQPSLSQRSDSLAGKILRMTPDGQPAPANPDPGSHVYALGIRNAQGLAWDEDGRLFATEFGPDVDDEINLIRAGGNYGWPHVTGQAGDPRFVDPIVVRQPPEASWSGAAILSGGSIPAWEGDLFAAALRGRRLWRLSLDDATVTGAEELLVGEFGRLRHVTQAPDGALWLLTDNGSDDRILRLGP